MWALLGFFVSLSDWSHTGFKGPVRGLQRGPDKKTCSWCDPRGDELSRGNLLFLNVTVLTEPRWARFCPHGLNKGLKPRMTSTNDLLQWACFLSCLGHLPLHYMLTCS